MDEVKKKRWKLTLLLSADVVIMTAFYLFWKSIYVTTQNNWFIGTALIITAVPLLYTVYKIWSLYYESDRVFPYFIVVILVIALAYRGANSLMHFSFERWQENEMLRPFMAIKFDKIQKGYITDGDNVYSNRYEAEFNLAEYTPEERRELLSVSDWRDEKPEVELDLGKKYYGEVYYAFNGLDFKDNWLVLIFEERGEKDVLVRSEFYESGKTAAWKRDDPEET